MRAVALLTTLLRRVGYGAKGGLFPLDASNIERYLPVGSDGQVLTADAASPGGLAWAAVSTAGTVGFGGQFGDGSAIVTTAGLEIELRAPWAGTITRMILDADVACSAVVDVKKNGTSIFTGTSVKPTLTAGTVDDKTSMTDITTSFAVADAFRIHLDSVSGSGTRLTLTIFAGT